MRAVSRNLVGDMVVKNVIVEVVKEEGEELMVSKQRRTEEAILLLSLSLSLYRKEWKCFSGFIEIANNKRKGECKYYLGSPFFIRFWSRKDSVSRVVGVQWKFPDVGGKFLAHKFW